MKWKPKYDGEPKTQTAFDDETGANLEVSPPRTSDTRLAFTAGKHHWSWSVTFAHDIRCLAILAGEAPDEKLAKHYAIKAAVWMAEQPWSEPLKSNPKSRRSRR